MGATANVIIDRKSLDLGVSPAPLADTEIPSAALYRVVAPTRQKTGDCSIVHLFDIRVKDAVLPRGPGLKLSSQQIKFFTAPFDGTGRPMR